MRRKTVVRLIVTLSMASVLCIGIAGIAAAEKELFTVKMGQMPYQDHLSYNIAMRKGWAEKLGLDLNVMKS